MIVNALKSEQAMKDILADISDRQCAQVRAGKEGKVRRSGRQRFQSKVVIYFLNLLALWIDYSKVFETLN